MIRKLFIMICEKLFARIFRKLFIEIIGGGQERCWW